MKKILTLFMACASTLLFSCQNSSSKPESDTSSKASLSSEIEEDAKKEARLRCEEKKAARENDDIRHSEVEREKMKHKIEMKEKYKEKMNDEDFQNLWESTMEEELKKCDDQSF